MENDNLEYRPHPWQALNLNWLTTGIICDDISAAIAFYRDTMQFTAIAEFPGDSGKLLGLTAACNERSTKVGRSAA